MKKLLLLFLSVPIFGFGQMDNKTFNPKMRNPFPKFDALSLTLGVSQHRYNFLEIGITKLHVMGTHHGDSMNGSTFSWRYNPWDNISVLNHSLWVKAPFVPFSLGVSEKVVLKKEKMDLAVAPEIGFGVGQLIFTYGYNIPLMKKSPHEFNTHYFSFRYHFVLKVLKSNFEKE